MSRLIMKKYLRYNSISRMLTYILAILAVLIVIIVCVVFYEHRQIAFLNLNFQKVIADLTALQHLLQDGLMNDAEYHAHHQHHQHHHHGHNRDFPFDGQDSDKESEESEQSEEDVTPSTYELDDGEVEQEVERIKEILETSEPEPTEEPDIPQPEPETHQPEPTSEPEPEQEVEVHTRGVSVDFEQEITVETSDVDSSPSGSKKKKNTPNEPAKNYDVDYTCVSENDGNTYRVEETRSGTKRWKRV